MVVRYSYTKTEPGAVGASLSKFFAGLESADKTFNRAANSNVIIPLSSALSPDSIDAELDVLAVVHPSRFFTISLDDKLSAIEASVSARCHALSKSEHVCADLIRIAAPRALFAAVPSLIRANALTDKPTELYLADASIPFEYLAPLAGNVSTMALDSGDFEGRFDELSRTEKLVKNVLDMQWVGLGLWRDEIKDVFGRPLVREFARVIRSVEITSLSPDARDSAAALLLAGWIADRAGVGRSVRATEGGFECSDGAGRSLRLNFRKAPACGGSRVTEVVFRFDSLHVGNQAQDQYVRLRHSGEALETLVDLNVSYRTTRPFEEESRVNRIRRYFLIGESMTNYTAASRLAMEFVRASRSSK